MYAIGFWLIHLKLLRLDQFEIFEVDSDVKPTYNSYI